MSKRLKSLSAHKNKLLRVEGKYAFHRGDIFSNFEEVADRLQAHTQESLVYYWIRDSRLVKYAHTKVSRKIDEKLQYYSIKFSCIFGGQRFKSKANGIRPCKRQTRQIDCPAFISLRATKCGRKLEVIDVCHDHTHEISEQAVEELPQKRRPSQAMLEEIQELLHLNVDKKMIIEYVKQKENKNILRKDLFNMATHMRLGLPRSRSVEEQKVILQRINLTATEEAIQHAVLRRLIQFDSVYPINTVAYQESLKSTQNTLDVFDTNNASAIDFTALSPEIDLLNSTDGIKNEIEYDELLSNRIIVDYEEEEVLEKVKSSTEPNNSSSDEKNWNQPSRPEGIYKDFICGDDTNYTYDDLQLSKEISKHDNMAPSSPHSPVADAPPDLDDKEYFNDLILICPEEAICSAEMSLNRAEHLGEDESIMDSMPCERSKSPMAGVEDTSETTKEPVRMLRRKNLSKFLARKTRQTIVNCRTCGTNARLIKMQISYLRQQRRKLIQETEILKLQKQKLSAEIGSFRTNVLL